MSAGGFWIKNETVADRKSTDDLCVYILLHLLNNGPKSTSSTKNYELYVELATILTVSEEYLTTLFGQLPMWFFDCKTALKKLKAQKLVKKLSYKRGKVHKYTKWYLTDTGTEIAKSLTNQAF